jgi:ketosteroid isomerase-like protein
VADEYRELDQERVLALHRFSARGKASGLDVAEVRSEGATLFVLREGKVARLVVYADRQSALARLGVNPEGDSV